MLFNDKTQYNFETDLRAQRFGYVHFFLATTVVLIMLTGIHHPYLWSPDEPREAEIAREALVDGHWVTPHLCGLPFLEKPPLFYDIVAAAYAVTGSISPTSARIIPTVFGGLMLASVFIFCNYWAGARCAWLSVFLLISMPKFYCYSHLILLDIAVGAFCTIALVSFAFWLWGPGSRAFKQALLCLFYFACAGAFLSKGVVGIFHVIVIVGTFCLVTWQWRKLRELIFAWPIFVFIIPIAAWIFLFYRDGGIAYLHEHFINNVIGRFLKTHFVLPGAQFYYTDLGKTGSWLFYIKNMPTTVGPALLLLLPAIWAAAKQIGSAVKRQRLKQDISAGIQLLFLIWAIMPIFLLSFSAAKETSYIIPSYAAMAILAGAWLNEQFSKLKTPQWAGIGWFAIAAVLAIFNIFMSGMNAKIYVIITLGFLSLSIPTLLILLYKRQFIQSSFLLIAVVISLVMIDRSPNVQYEFRRSYCAILLSKDVLARIGDKPLYVYKPKDMLRGSIAFYGNRPVSEIDIPEQLRSVLTSGQECFIVMDRRKMPTKNEDVPENLYTSQILPDYGLPLRYVLLTPASK